jgi:hypothetical protein
MGKIAGLPPHVQGLPRFQISGAIMKRETQRS